MHTECAEHVDFVVEIHAVVDMGLSNEMAVVAVRHSDRTDDVVVVVA